MPIVKKLTSTSVVIELKFELEKLPENLFVAKWQHSKFPNLIKNIPENTVILNMDFNENYSCVSQHEVQSAHCGHNQITIHPTVSYYDFRFEICSKIVTDALIFLTDDLTHDA